MNQYIQNPKPYFYKPIFKPVKPPLQRYNCQVSEEPPQPPVIYEYNSYSKYKNNYKPISQYNNIEDKPIPTKGFCQWCNFGKFYRKTPENPNPPLLNFYDLANKNEFKYLRWLLKVNQDPKKWKFKINENCIPHIRAAIQTDGFDEKWEMTTEESKLNEEGKPIEPGIQILKFKVNMFGKDITGPDIIMRNCMNCNRSRNEVGMIKTEKGFLCKYCNDQINRK